MRLREYDLLCDWLVRDFEPDLAARFRTAVSEARRGWIAALLGRGGRRVSVAGRTGLRVRGAGSLGKPVEAASGRGEGAALGLALRAKPGASFRGVARRCGCGSLQVVPASWELGVAGREPLVPFSEQQSLPRGKSGV